MVPRFSTPLAADSGPHNCTRVWLGAIKTTERSETSGCVTCMVTVMSEMRELSVKTIGEEIGVPEPRKLRGVSVAHSAPNTTRLAARKNTNPMATP